MTKNNNGYILFDKPAGWTSFDCVNFVKKKYGIHKAGHAGSLDPIATGLLIIMFNNATRLFDHFQKHDKIYEAAMILGMSFDTQDITGNMLTLSAPDNIPPVEKVTEILEGFRGLIEQTPPVYSAIKIKGRPAYSYARNGAPPEMAPRAVQIEHTELVKYSFPRIHFRVACKKGFYVRAFCEDIAKKLGTLGVLSGLKRTAQSGHELKDAINIHNLPEDITPYIKYCEQ